MAETRMLLEDWLDDLCVRFIINLPNEELESVERICFQIEEAQWFYEDFIRALDPSLPSMTLRVFCMRIFQHCPLFSGFSLYHRSTAFEEFLAYKTRVPVRGAIMLNETMDQVVLVKGWKKGSSWSFPRGKINKDEGDLDCAIREVYEETGFDVRKAGLIADEANTKSIEVVMREQNVRLFVFNKVPMNTDFAPRTRKEISAIEWHRLTDLPMFKKTKTQNGHNHNELANNANKFYMVAPFLAPLKKWIAQQKALDAANSQHSAMKPHHTTVERGSRGPVGKSVELGPIQHPQQIQEAGSDEVHIPQLRQDSSAHLMSLIGKQPLNKEAISQSLKGLLPQASMTLTPHREGLVDLFKAADGSNRHSSQPVSSNINIVNEPPMTFSSTHVPPPAEPKPITKHQSALLSLFRTPSGTGSQVSALPVIEKLAMAPGQSARMSSEAETADPAQSAASNTAAQKFQSQAHQPIPSHASSRSFDRRNILPEKQRETLLSLFNKTGSTSPTGTTNTSTVTANAPSEPPRTRLSQLETTPQISSPSLQSPTGSLRMDGKPRTPTRALDKKLMMEFLEGVARSSGR